MDKFRMAKRLENLAASFEKDARQRQELGRYEEGEASSSSAQAYADAARRIRKLADELFSETCADVSDRLRKLADDSSSEKGGLALKHIVVLEDQESRIDFLRQHFPHYEIVWFADVSPFLAAVKEHRETLCLVVFDHDLGRMGPPDGPYSSPKPYYDVEGKTGRRSET